MNTPLIAEQTFQPCVKIYIQGFSKHSASMRRFTSEAMQRLIALGQDHPLNALCSQLKCFHSSSARKQRRRSRSSIRQYRIARRIVFVLFRSLLKNERFNSHYLDNALTQPARRSRLTRLTMALVLHKQN